MFSRGPSASNAPIAAFPRVTWIIWNSAALAVPELDGRGAHILLDGEVKAVTTEIDEDPFYELLADRPIPAKVDAKVRALFKA